MHRLKMQRLAMQFRTLDFSVPLKFPRENCGEIFIVTLRFAVGSLMFLSEMSAARFVPLKSIDAHQFGEFEKISDPSGAFERLVVAFAFAGDSHLFPKFIAQIRNFLERLAQTRRISRHAAFVPKQQTQVTVE